MRTRRTSAALVTFALASTITWAQEKDVTQIGVRLGPPVPFGLPGGGSCAEPGVAIPDNNSVGVSSVILIENNPTQPPPNLEVAVGITHTWVGDLRVTLQHAFTRTIIDRPGVPASAFGCSRDDIDVNLTNLGIPSVEDLCAASVPTISGVAKPFPDMLSFLAPGLTVEGGWTLNVADLAGGDVGTFDGWCINVVSGPDGPGTGGGVTSGDPAGPATGGSPTPATSGWGVMVLIAVFLGVMTYELRRRNAH